MNDGNRRGKKRLVRLRLHDQGPVVKVLQQADAPFRSSPEDLGHFSIMRKPRWWPGFRFAASSLRS